LARLRAHRNNIDRYHVLLRTKLSDIERPFIERRLAEKQNAADELASGERLPDCSEVRRYVGNLPPMPRAFPDYPVPVIRNTEDRPRVDNSPASKLVSLGFGLLLQQQDMRSYLIKPLFSNIAK
jgi:hypothetical protein